VSTNYVIRCKSFKTIDIRFSKHICKFMDYGNLFFASFKL